MRWQASSSFSDTVSCWFLSTSSMQAFRILLEFPSFIEKRADTFGKSSNHRSKPFFFSEAAVWSCQDQTRRTTFLENPECDGQCYMHNSLTNLKTTRSIATMMRTRQVPSDHVISLRCSWKAFVKLEWTYSYTTILLPLAMVDRKSPGRTPRKSLPLWILLIKSLKVLSPS